MTPRQLSRDAPIGAATVRERVLPSRRLGLEAIALLALRQRKRNIRAGNPALGGRKQSYLRGSAENYELPAARLIHRRHALERRIQFFLPKHLAICQIERAHFPVPRSGKDKSAGSDYRAHLRIMRAGILETLRRQFGDIAQWDFPLDAPLIQVIHSEGRPRRSDRREPAAGN